MITATTTATPPSWCGSILEWHQLTRTLRSQETSSMFRRIFQRWSMCVSRRRLRVHEHLFLITWTITSIQFITFTFTLANSRSAHILLLSRAARYLICFFVFFLLCTYTLPVNTFGRLLWSSYKVRVNTAQCATSWQLVPQKINSFNKRAFIINNFLCQRCVLATVTEQCIHDTVIAYVNTRRECVFRLI